MKVKKFKQIIEKSDFDTKDETTFNIYGKKMNSSYYELLEKSYNIDDCTNWYERNVKNNKDIWYTVFGNSYSEIIITEEIVKTKIIDINLIINSKKYNL